MKPWKIETSHISSIRIDEAFLNLIGIQEKTNINEMYVSKLIKVAHFLRKYNLPIKDLYPPLLCLRPWRAYYKVVFRKLLMTKAISDHAKNFKHYINVAPFSLKYNSNTWTSFILHACSGKTSNNWQKDSGPFLIRKILQYLQNSQ